MRTFILLSLLFICSSCIEKRITRLDRRAVQRVEAKRTLLDQVFYEGLKLHPCINDTVTKTKTDTTTVVQFFETVKNDTIFMEKIKTITRIDTVFKTVLDKQVIGILTDTINSKNKQLSFKDGQLFGISEQLKSKEKKELYLYLTIIGLVCSIGIGVYLKLRKIIKI